MTSPTTFKSLTEMANEVFHWTREKGWSNDGKTFGDEIALLHSEASEALEAWREWGFKDMTALPTEMIPVPKPEGVGSELADLLIRLLDTAVRHSVDLAAEYERKMEYNRTRPFRHGGKLL
jgi:NTP pyrophosphatase (non-canonical NTP hydrolase)